MNEVVRKKSEQKVEPSIIQNEEDEEESKCLQAIQLMLRIILVLLTFFALVFLLFYMKTRIKNVKILASEKEIVKSLVDNRKYRMIQLENNLIAMLISDPDAVKSSAALTVNAGSFNDDPEVPGIAHLTSHVLFSGSSVFSLPKKFEDYLSLAFGSSNSFVEDEKTVFFFEMSSQLYGKGLDIFGDLFEVPEITEENIAMQLNNIETEYKKIKSSDRWKERQLIKIHGNPKHPFSKFSHGDASALRKLDKLRLKNLVDEFYRRYYTPSNMRLLLVSNLNMELLEELADNFFAVRTFTGGNTTKGNNNSEQVKAYNPGDLGKLIWYQKLPEYLPPNLDIIFITDEVSSYNRIKPLDYVTYMLNYAGDGSLLSLLKSNNIAVKINCGIIARFKTFTQYGISIQLTDNGKTHVIEAIDETFGYLNLIQSQLVNDEYNSTFSTYEEILKIANSTFSFLLKSDRSEEYFTDLSMKMLDYDPIDVVKNEYVHSLYNETIIKSFTKSLTPENAMIIVGSSTMPRSLEKEFDKSPAKVEKYFNTTYKSRKFNNSFISVEKNEKMKLRPVNPFITNATTSRKLIYCLEKSRNYIFKKKNPDKYCTPEYSEYTSKLVLNTLNIKLWYRLDRTFGPPKVNINFYIYTPFFRMDNTTVAYLNIYYEYFLLVIDQHLSEAKDADNDIRTEINENGILIKTDSYIDVAPKIVETILDFFFNSKNLTNHLPEEDFIQMLEFAKERYRNGLHLNPDDTLRQLFLDIVKKGVTNNEEAFIALTDSEMMRYDLFLKAMKTFQPSFFLEQLVYGALESDQFKEILDIVKPYSKTFNASSTEQNLAAFRLLDTLHSHNLINGSYVFRKYVTAGDMKGHLLSNYYQIGPRKQKTRLLMWLLEQVWSNSINFELSKNNGVRKILASESRIIDGTLYFVFTVKSAVHPDIINNDLDKILAMVIEKVNNLNDTMLETYKNPIRLDLKRYFINLPQKARLAWEEIYEDSLDFNFRATMKETLNTIKIKDLIAFCKELFISQPRKLSIIIYYNEKKQPLKIREPYGVLNKTLSSLVYEDSEFLSNAKSVSLRRSVE